jgi:hypothetical protein
MLRMLIDWVDEREPNGRPVESVLGDAGDGVRVELSKAGTDESWPELAVYAAGESGAEAGPKLWAWLVEQGWGEDEASDACSLAESV